MCRSISKFTGFVIVLLTVPLYNYMLLDVEYSTITRIIYNTLY